MKRFKHGFVLGKFMPLHNGHLHMIHTAEKNCEHLTILVGTLSTEPIPGWVRYEWMKKLMPNTTVIHITEDLPQYPHEHPDFWNIWTAVFKKHIHSDTDVFFSSEEYGYEVAARLGIRHEIVDEERITIPVSGTAIRTNPLKNWEYIPDVVKPYFAKKVIITGPESTGKSTMGHLLATHYGTTCIEEYGREYCEKEIPGKTTLELKDFLNIGRVQHFQMIDDFNANINKIIFSDTDLIVTEVYSRLYLNDCPAIISETNSEVKYDLYLLMDIDLPWEDDGTRIFLSREKRQEHFNACKEALERYDCKYVVISGTSTDRMNNAIKAINNEFPDL